MKRAVISAAVLLCSGCTYGAVDVVSSNGTIEPAPVSKLVFQNASTFTDYVTYTSGLKVGATTYVSFSFDPSKPQPSEPGANDQLELPNGKYYVSAYFINTPPSLWWISDEVTLNYPQTCTDHYTNQSTYCDELEVQIQDCSPWGINNVWPTTSTWTDAAISACWNARVPHEIPGNANAAAVIKLFPNPFWNGLTITE
jgi:hypothetical protein